MGINTTLFREIQDYLYDYGCNFEEMNHFLFANNDFLNRQQEAIEIINRVMTFHGKEELLTHVVELARVEHGIQELEPWVRDHVVHALLCYTLGIYINEKYLSFNGSNSISHFQWKLAGLFHDIGYPAQIARDIINPYTKKINEIRRRYVINSQDIRINLIPVGLELLQNEQNGLDLIQSCLNQWNLDINARGEYNRMVQDGRICHGIMSGLTLLNIVDVMYQYYNPLREYRDTYTYNMNINWNQVNFEHQVIPACSAIFIHNLPEDRFESSKLDPEIAPLPFLLKLTDILQEWERPSLLNMMGYPSRDFDIAITTDRILRFFVNNDDIKRNIDRAIHNTLNVNNVLII